MKKRSKSNKKDIQIQRVLSKNERTKIWLVTAFFTFTTLILSLMVGFKYAFNIDSPKYFGSTWALLLGILFPIRGALTKVLLEYLKNRETPDTPIFRRVYKIRNIVSIALISILIFPIIYNSPIRTQIGDFFLSIKSISKQIGEYLSNIISVLLSGLSGMLGNILLGVIGNFVYDVGKAIYKKHKNRSVKESKKIKKHHG
jgi:hypothetical protein